MNKLGRGGVSQVATLTTMSNTTTNITNATVVAAPTTAQTFSKLPQSEQMELALKYPGLATALVVDAIFLYLLTKKTLGSRTRYYSLQKSS